MQHFILEADLSSSLLSITDKDILHQMKNVLRFRPGESCIVLNGQGARAQGKIRELHRHGAVIELSKLETFPSPKTALRLYCALPKKPSTFEWVLQKATELGVTELIPLISERCQVKDLKKAPRLEAIVKEAAEQAERLFLPILQTPVELKSLLKELPEGTCLVGDAREGEALPKGLKGDLNLFIGPEGGFSPQELEEFKKKGAHIFKLGDTVLRVETAAVAALSLLRYN